MIRLSPFAHAVDLHGKSYEDRAKNDGGSEVDEPTQPDKAGRCSERRQEDTIDQDLASRLIASGNDGQHGHPDPLVVARTIKRQRPEVRWSPEENDQEEQNALEAHRPRYSRPADHGREGAG